MATLPVLDVGNCDPDHSALRQLLTTHFDVAVDRVMFVADALDRMRSRRYALVLVNRLIFADGSAGMELIRAAQADAALRDQPIMLISNYADARAEAVAAGGVAGFGKADMGDRRTVELIAGYVGGPANSHNSIK
ncbi:MAG: hypothetical protein U1A27_11445 [Phycisphaerae bacterium]